jgi:pyrroloquinoline quinone biosynthesis protein E
VHRANIGRISEMVDLALKLKAGRIEIVHVQYDGWALKNRIALMPTAEQVARAAAVVEEQCRKHQGKIVIDAVPPDCGGGGGRWLTVTPSGHVMPGPVARSIAGPTFWNVRDHALDDIWANSPAFNASRRADFLTAPRAGCTEPAAEQQDTPYVYRRM